jgi:hypothetical protein
VRFLSSPLAATLSPPVSDDESDLLSEALYGAREQEPSSEEWLSLLLALRRLRS